MFDVDDNGFFQSWQEVSSLRIGKKSPGRVFSEVDAKPNQASLEVQIGPIYGTIHNCLQLENSCQFKASTQKFELVQARNKLLTVGGGLNR